MRGWIASSFWGFNHLAIAKSANLFLIMHHDLQAHWKPICTKIFLYIFIVCIFKLIWHTHTYNIYILTVFFWLYIDILTLYFLFNLKRYTPVQLKVACNINKKPPGSSVIHGLIQGLCSWLWCLWLSLGDEEKSPTINLSTRENPAPSLDPRKSPWIPKQKNGCFQGLRFFKFSGVF